ncbi:hypothetical protein [Micromonospora sp. NPDC049662]|uniref:hypothetical protein n=1 Tax=Micromonospora sp. NPDC049662 TaxID=3155397 RepID=UPI0034294E4E
MQQSGHVATPPAISDTSVDQAGRLETLRTEYQELKAEQRGRIESRDGLIYTAMGVAAAVVAGVSQTKIPLLLLTLPPAVLVLGWTYLAKDRMVSAIGRYLRDDLRVQMEALAGGPLLGWEFGHGDDTRRSQRKRIQAAVDLGTFCLPAVAAIVACLALAPTPLAIAIAAAELGAVAVLAWQILAYAEDIRPGRR